MRNRLFLVVSIFTFMITLFNSDFASNSLTYSLLFPVIAFISLAASIILFAQRHNESE